jgi:hypothetical protein
VLMTARNTCFIAASALFAEHQAQSVRIFR